MARLRVREVINSTGRLTIRERDVSLVVSSESPTVRVAELTLPSPSDDSMPGFDDAEVWIEAAQPRTASFDRWQLGPVRSVRDRRPVGIRELRNFSDASDAVFTIKVVSPDGRILASSDDIRPDDRRAGEQEALLQVRVQSLGEMPWTVEFAPDYQTFLVVNGRIPEAAVWIEKDPIATSLVLPAAIRRILLQLVLDEGFRDSDWGEAWAAWAARIAPRDMPAGEDHTDGLEWIEQTVEAFSRTHRTTEQLVAAVEAAPGEA
jgi:hypothetical protein